MPTLDYHSPRRFNKLEPLSIASVGLIPALSSVGLGLIAFLTASAAPPFFHSGDMDVGMFWALASLNSAFIGWLCVLNTFMRPRGTVCGALTSAVMLAWSLMTLAAL